MCENIYFISLQQHERTMEEQHDLIVCYQLSLFPDFIFRLKCFQYEKAYKFKMTYWVLTIAYLVFQLTNYYGPSHFLTGIITPVGYKTLHSANSS